MSQSDKKKLYQKLFKIDQLDMEYVVEILLKGKYQLMMTDDMEIDLDKCETKVLRELQNFVMLRD